MKSKLKPNQKVKYIGKGFLGFDPQNPYAIFVSYCTNEDIIINYKKSKIKVRIWEIEPC